MPLVDSPPAAPHLRGAALAEANTAGRPVILITLVATLSAAGALAAGPPAQPEKERRPNWLVITEGQNDGRGGPTPQ